MDTYKKPLKILAVTFGSLYVLEIAAFCYDIRFDNPQLNRLATVFLWSMFIYLFCVSTYFLFNWTSKRKWVRVVHLLFTMFLGLCALAGALSMLLTLLDFVSSYHVTQEIHRTHFGSTDIVFYLSDCGAMCDFDLDIEQE